jgi:phosphate-selective porin OprO and OprP
VLEPIRRRQHRGVAIVLLLAAFVVAATRASSAQSQSPAASPDAAGGSQATSESKPTASAPDQSNDQEKAKKEKDKNGSKDQKKSKKKAGSKKQSGKTDGTLEGSSSENVKPPKHPSWQPMPGVRLDFKARIETQIRPASPEETVDDGVLQWQDRRIGVEGSLFKRVSFEVARELSDDFTTTTPDVSEKSAWKDAYVSGKVAKALSIDVGRFKLPFGREELTAETNRDFAYRSMASRVLPPGRDVGVMAHGKLFDRRAEYQIGYFTRDGENGRTSQTQGGRDSVVARLVVSPFRGLADRLIAPLEVGVGIADSHLDNRLGLRGRTILGDGIFFDRVYVNGLRRRIGVDAGWANGPVSLSGELISVTEERRDMGFDGDDLPSVGARAWSLAATWALTGERKHGRLEPKHDLFRGGFGAVEMALRTEALTFPSTTSPTGSLAFSSNALLLGNADHATTVGVNWYLNHYVKLQSDVVMEWIEDPARSPAPASEGHFVSSIFLLQFHF